MIGRDPHPTAGLEARGKKLEIDTVEKPALSLAFLGPWVREIDMKRGHGRERQRGLDEMPRVRTDYADVGQTRTRDTFAADPIVGERELDPQKIVLRRPARGFDQEAGLAAPDLDLERRPPFELHERIPGSARIDVFVRRRRPAAACRLVRVAQRRGGERHGAVAGFIGADLRRPFRKPACWPSRPDRPFGRPRRGYREGPSPRAGRFRRSPGAGASGWSSKE